MDKKIATIADLAADGGNARAESLSAGERSAIASKAADARWSIPRVTHGSPDKPLRIGNLEIPCYVLDGKTRVITQAGFLEALGRHRKARVRNPAGEDPIPAMIQGKSINPFISKELIEKSKPIIFRMPDGGRAKGYQAEILPEVCEVYLKARDAGELPANQKHVAKQAEILIRGLAHVGIIALVDEATGYQHDRARHALEEILEQFISKELVRWAKTFQDEFYEQMFRLRGWTYSHVSTRKPLLAAKLTIDIVYRRLAPGVLTELQRLTPRDDKGRLKHKMYWRLTPDVGHPKLKEHLAAVTAMMRGFDDRDWAGFNKMLNRSLPKQIQGPHLFQDFENGNTAEES